MWNLDELKAIGDIELISEALEYKGNLEEEFELVEKARAMYPQHFGTISREFFLDSYLLVITRCFGWELPSSLCVPLADIANHSTFDMSYELFNSRLHKEKANQYYTNARKKINFPEFVPDTLNTTTAIKTLQVDSSIYSIALDIQRENFTDILINDKIDIWNVGFYSTSDSEDNDTEEDEEDDQFNQNKIIEIGDGTIKDPSTTILQLIEKYQKEQYSQQTEEANGHKSYLASKTDNKEIKVNEKLVFKIVHKNAPTRKSSDEEEKDKFTWFNDNDKDNYFCLCTAAKTYYKKGEQVFYCYGSRSNRFLMIK